jgi:hypothetical protein
MLLNADEINKILIILPQFLTKSTTAYAYDAGRRLASVRPRNGSI